MSEVSRKLWLESLCEAKAEAGEGSKEMVLRRLIRIEDQRKNARIIGRVNGKLPSGSVTSVVAPNEDGEWVEVVGKEGIEKALWKKMSDGLIRLRRLRFCSNHYLIWWVSWALGRRQSRS